MSLFSNQQDANLESARALIEDVLIELDHRVDECRYEDEDAVFAWKIRKGSADTLIQVQRHEGFFALRVCAHVITMDDSTRREPLYTKLLQLNARAIHGAAFAVQGERVLLLGERSTLGLDRRELLSLIATVRNLADEYDDRFVQKYGGKLSPESSELTETISD